MPTLRLRPVLALATLLTALALGTALASERWGGLIPCPLCLVERWPYRVAILFGLAGVFLPHAWARYAGALFALSMLAGVAAGATHVGVERGLWPSPLPECRGVNMSGLSISQRLAVMPARPSKPCEDAVFLIPWLPVSFAEMDLIFTVMMTAGVATTVVASWRQPD
jgi:disulfide bond formation protein DsbB